MQTLFQTARLTLSALSLCTSCAAIAAPGDVRNFDHVLEGAQGDRFSVRLVHESTKFADRVIVCLFDQTASNTARAFDIRASQSPRFWTRPNGGPGCGGVSDTRHRVSFFEASATGVIREILRTTLDLSGLGGRRVDIIWTHSSH